LTCTFVERVLRLLITQGWFREPIQGYFANNRLSNLIKKDQHGYHLATYMLVYVSKSLLQVVVVLIPNFLGMISSTKFPRAFRKRSITPISIFVRRLTLSILPSNLPSKPIRPGVLGKLQTWTKSSWARRRRDPR
jgi:hypothetical protein